MTELADLRNTLELTGGSLRIAARGARVRVMTGDGGSGLSGCLYDDPADALELTMAVRAERSAPRAWIDPAWR